eukprot:Gb_00166 [translate_table: standard]
MEPFRATFLATLFIILTGACSITNPTDIAAINAVMDSVIDNDNNLRNWGSGDPCTDNWNGVYCSDPDEYGTQNVIKLHLMKLNLTGSLAPEIGSISHLEVLDFMWNNISGSIPKEIGKLAELQLLLLNGNRLTGSLPEELGNLINLDRLQIDENNISGPLPRSLHNLKKAQHFHMNNNLLNGTIPRQLGSLPNLIHLLLDNNNLQGDLPPELGNIPTLRILQLDNNKINGRVPKEYTKLKQLLKLSLRNCSLQGPIPDFSEFPILEYLDLSYNLFEGLIRTGPFSPNITTINLSYNNLSGQLPKGFGNLPNLQALLLKNNQINGSIPSDLGSNLVSQASMSYIVLDFQNNALTDIDVKQISGLPQNISVWLYNNPVCKRQEFTQFCVYQNISLADESTSFENTNGDCNPSSCVPQRDELIPELALSGQCVCATPVLVGLRLKSPGFTFFPRYKSDFRTYLSEGLNLISYQIYIVSYKWESGPRLSIQVKLFPLVEGQRQFNCSELQNMFSKLADWKLHDNGIFGPKDLRHFDAYMLRTGNCMPVSASKHISTGAIIGIIFACVLGTAVTVTLFLFWIVGKPNLRGQRLSLSRRGLLRGTRSKKLFKISEVKSFSFEEISKATNKFSEKMEIGQGGYGKVYRGLLENGEIVAIKRASGGSLEGENEFYEEIRLLSFVHHRNLVSLVGYCDERDEQMLVYEFMENGSLHDHLHKNETPGFQYLDFRTRLSIALGSARGILYLHTEVDPPILHHDIKSSNILLDKKKIAKISDFGLSKQSQAFDIKGNPTHSISTKVKGTPGYLDPEYFLTCAMTTKSDVYSFGVVMVELLTGRQPTSGEKSIVKQVREAWEGGLIGSWIDERMGWHPMDDVCRMIELALACVHPNPDSRPPISEVVKRLYIISSQYSANDDSGSKDQILSKSEIKKSQERDSLEMNLSTGSSVPSFAVSMQGEGEKRDISNNETKSIIHHLVGR